MYRIEEHQEKATAIHLFKVAAPEIARKARPGQFIIIQLDEKGERIPLTLAEWDAGRGTITFIFMEVGATTCRLARLQAGDYVQHVVGPLGLPAHIENFGTVVCAAGGVGVAPIMPIARALKRAGNFIISILGARTQELLFWEQELRQTSDEFIVTTDNGSYGRKALITEPLKEILSSRKIDRVIAIGPIPMMKFCSLTTRPFGVNTIVSLNPLMLDGTGMCGCCRVSIAGSTKFACVDGPDFDGHQVDWDLMAYRAKFYTAEENTANEKHSCQLPFNKKGLP
ncbi:MAG TPA: sulfide/dihydroorotate dehydrogenase-like FAD/NAD-binding protein [Dehalococcoidales bacterium]|nr:sulfide/dihydroorotate dehydrogenase-like FAD/NAD-binding protein [Dehalococcoidales bacterium]